MTNTNLKTIHAGGVKVIEVNLDIQENQTYAVVTPVRNTNHTSYKER